MFLTRRIAFIVWALIIVLDVLLLRVVIKP